VRGVDVDVAAHALSGANRVPPTPACDTDRLARARPTFALERPTRGQSGESSRHRRWEAVT
jgi:hypothetical protein